MLSSFLEVEHICTRVAVNISSKVGHIFTLIAAKILITPDKKNKKLATIILLKHICFHICFKPYLI